MATPVPGRFRHETLILSSKSLILLDFSVPNLSSICHGEALARLGGDCAPASQQSYPQLL